MIELTENQKTMISTAVDAAFDETLEIAAEVADEFEFLNNYEMRAAQEIAKRIRSLKKETTS